MVNQSGFLAALIIIASGGALAAEAETSSDQQGQLAVEASAPTTTGADVKQASANVPIDTSQDPHPAAKPAYLNGGYFGGYRDDE